LGWRFDAHEDCQHQQGCPCDRRDCFPAIVKSGKEHVALVAANPGPRQLSERGKASQEGYGKHTSGQVLERRRTHVRALMYGWGKGLNWAALAAAWLLTFVIGIAIYFLPIARLLDSLTE
jgi:hypothetical protein